MINSKYVKYHHKKNNKIAVLLLLLMMIFQPRILTAQTPNNVGNFQVAFSTNVFKGVYLNDAMAGAKVLTETLMDEYSRTKYEVLPPTSFSTIEELENLIKSQEVEAFIMHATELLKLSNPGSLEPICVAIRNESPYDIFYLLVNKRSEYKTVESLKNKRILIGSPFEADIPVLWLDNLLKERELERKEKYFSSIEYFEKALPSILPVFFGKADACIVTKSLFETVIELNPQISKELATIEISKPISIGIIAIRRNISDPDLKEDIKRAFINLHKHANGRQYLHIFRSERIGEFKTEHLASTYEILNLNER
jgi:ABC-type phosphate/phosphonate transport system substrate-binding protein